jgi:hypothetical protein
MSREAVMSTTAVEMPGYVAGTFTIDPGHSDVAFTVRHLMVSKVPATSPASRANSPSPRPAGLLGDGHHRARLHRHQQPPTRRRPPLSKLLRDRHPPDDDLPLHRHPPQRGWLRCRRRADLARGDPAGHSGPGRQRLHPRPLRRHPGWLLGHHRAGPRRLRQQQNIPMDGGVVIGTVSRSSLRSKPSATHPGRPAPNTARRPPEGIRQPLP